MSRVSGSGPELVHPVPVEEVPAWVRTMTATFLRDPHQPDSVRQSDMLTRVWEPGRAWGVRDRGRWVATLRTEPRVVTVPGVAGQTRDLTVDALTNVTVSATHRRQGLLRRMISESLAAARARGDALSILIAAEWPIYGRYGYAPGTAAANYVLRRVRSGAIRGADPARVRQVERDEFADHAAAVHAASRRRRAGQVNRDGVWWNRVLGRDGYEPSPDLPHNWLIHEGDDGPDGLLAWKAGDGEFGLIPPHAEVDTWELASASDTAYHNLWGYLAGIDGVDEISVSWRPVDEEVRWLLDDARALVMTQHVDFLWVRLLDVPAALSARRYALPGQVVLEVHDEDGGRFAAGRYRLRADGDHVECERTDAQPDIAITQRALASIYLGGYRLRQLLIAGAAVEFTAGALERVDLMFSTPLAPWNATWF